MRQFRTEGQVGIRVACRDSASETGLANLVPSQQSEESHLFQSYSKETVNFGFASADWELAKGAQGRQSTIDRGNSGKQC